jgi:hypothetical protein
MRQWGLIITVFYGCALMFFVLPLLGWLSSTELAHWQFWWPDLWDRNVIAWLVMLMTGQVLLLFVSVDNSFKRLRPRASLVVSIATTASMVGLLTAAALLSLVAAIWGDDGVGALTTFRFWGGIAACWLLWGIVFGAYAAALSSRLDRVVAWLLRGSVLELLIAVPCHVVVRQRDDCSAPAATAFGIATGIAVMLMSFGPSVVFLYRKRLQRYAASVPGRGKPPDEP